MKRAFFASLTAATFVTLLFSQTARASVIWAEDFNYSDGDLTNVSSGAWIHFSGTGNLIQVVNNAALLSGSAASSEDARRPLGGTISSGSLYMSALVTVTTEPTSANGEYFLSFYSVANGYVGRVTSSQTATGWTLGLANGTSSAIMDWGTDLSLNTQYKVVVKLDVAAGTATMGVFDPMFVPSSDTELTLGGDTPSTVVAVDNIALRQNTSAQGAQTIESVWVGTTLGDVATLIPEPSSILLASLGGLLLLAVVRRHR
jgi:PEP-CTERM motif